MIIVLIISALINIYFALKTLKRKKMEQDQLILTFYIGNNGRTIANNQNGKICLLDIEYCKKNKIYVKAGEDWRCAISIEKEHVLIVQPITRTLTAQENEQLFEIKKNELSEKYKKGSPGSNGRRTS
jgi:hypothetical protein